ncbi:MAG: GNAT family N-acetyltransferase [Pyrinomonadaceae bacterium]|nr:GNAT family N-acetyltransferase [Pyrinomonadaceae bacterium]
MPEVIIRLIPAEEARPLRGAILRPNLPLEKSVYPGDDAHDTLHLGAYVMDELVGVASVFHQPPPGESLSAAWRLRGMAVRTNAQGRGYGRALLEHCIAHVAKQGGTLFWCNGRTSALSFYRSFGLEPRGEEFDVPDSGSHFVLHLRINQPTP